MVKKIALDDQTQTILTYMTFSDGADGAVIGKITSQLERKTYEKVNKALTALGGKWNRKAGGHIFATDPRPHVDDAIEEGAVTVEKDGFFETPPEVVDRMVTICGDLTGLSILEPSAGLGAIADRLTDAESIFCIEKNPDRCALLRQKGYDVHNADFLASGPFLHGFDRIIQNPPFESGQDIDHVRHAYTMLAPDGFLISVMSEGPFFRSDRKATEFRDWLDEVGGHSIELPDKSFHASGTDVKTRLVMIRAPRALASARMTLVKKGEPTMRTTIQAQELGTFTLEDEGKLTIRQALKENGLNPKEWTLASTHETKTTITYTLTRKSEKAVDSGTSEPVNSYEAETDTDSAQSAASSTPDDSPQSPVPSPQSVASPESTSSPVPQFTVLSIPRKPLEEALKVACDFATPRTTLPILTNVRLTSDGETLTVYATDLECYWTRTVPGARVSAPDSASSQSTSSAVHQFTASPISTAVYASILYSEVKALDADVDQVMLTIDSEARTLSVNGRCSIHTSDPEEFPEQPTITGPEVAITDLPAKLKTVEPAICTDQTRYVLNGAQIDFAGGKVVATDGFRLHHTDVEIETTGDVLPVILPHRAVSLIVKHGSDSIITIDGTDARKYISYPLQGGVMVSRLLEGSFPDWRNVLPTDLPISVEFDPKDFMKIVEGVIPIAGAKSTIALTVNGSLSMETTGDCGSYHWQIPCYVTGKGDASYRLLYNLKFLTDALKCYAGDGPAILEFGATYGATLINAHAIVMPIRS